MFRYRFRQRRFVMVAGVMVVSQSTLTQTLTIAGVVPDFPLLLVVFFALHHDAVRGMYCGIAVGFLSDVLSSGIMGIQMLALGCVGALAGLLQDRVYTSHLITRCGVPFVLSVVSALIYYLCAIRFHRLVPLESFSAVALRGGGYTAVINIFFSAFLERILIERTLTLQ